MYPHNQHNEDQPILDVRKLNVLYDGRPALVEITFHLHVGERVAVVGPNGAGKSTLFKAVVGVQPVTSGEVLIYGSGPKKHVCIGYVPQRNQIDWNFPVSVADVVMMGRIAKLGTFGWPKKQDWDKVHSALEMVNMDHLSSRQIAQLSGGQQQRMFLARALAQEAELILMDEPLTGLDIPSQESILRLLDELKSRDVTVVVATHDLEQASTAFDRVMLLNRKLIGFGTPDEVLRPEKLLEAYGKKVHLTDKTMLVDECCQ
ncbi:MAG: metal ABC transporter ATP-binding protein [Anaerolineales bacterium]|nr:metal ABC transporter ATP-binding protein [Anaerolineales bacterium]